MQPSRQPPKPSAGSGPRCAAHFGAWVLALRASKGLPGGGNLHQIAGIARGVAAAVRLPPEHARGLVSRVVIDVAVLYEAREACAA